MKQALILGCSHAAGSEISEDYRYNYAHSFPALIANALGYVSMNHSIPGGSNDAMFRIFEQSLSSLDCNDIVIVCWSGGDRSEVYHNSDQQWLPLNVGQNGWLKTQPDAVMCEGHPKPMANTPRLFYETISDMSLYQDYLKSWIVFNTNEIASRANKIKNIIALNTLAKFKNIKVINIDSFDPVTDCETLDQYFWPAPVYLQWCLDHNFQHSSSMHFAEDAHRAYATTAIQSIQSMVSIV